MSDNFERVVELRAHGNWFFAILFARISSDDMLASQDAYGLKALRFAYTPGELEDRMKELNERKLHMTFALVRTGKKTRYTSNLATALKFLESR